MNTSKTEITLKLTGDEALVLFDWLNRVSDFSNAEFQDQAEQRALWNVIAVLETQLVEIFDPRYRERLLEARDRLRDN